VAGIKRDVGCYFEEGYLP
jgi:hypothetical protein